MTSIQYPLTSGTLSHQPRNPFHNWRVSKILHVNSMNETPKNSKDSLFKPKRSPLITNPYNLYWISLIDYRMMLKNNLPKFLSSKIRAAQYMKSLSKERGQVLFRRKINIFWFRILHKR